MNSLHIKMTKPIAEATIVGDFRDGTKFADHDRAYTFGTKDGKPYVSVSFGGRVPETFNVDYTLGAKRYQGYLATLPGGRIYVLPVFWHIASKRWVDWKEITPIPDGAHDIRQIWNANCFNCHGTNIVQGYDVAAKKYQSTWTEMGIGCEACHGPGREHIALMDAWEKDPASKPKYDNSSKNRQLSDILKIFSVKSSEPRRIYDTCAYCHGNKRNVFVGFKGGDRYADYAMPFLISDPIPDNDLQGEFWPDGRPNRFNRPQALTMSGCFKAGAIACTSCHVAHGSRNEFSLKVNINQGRNGDALCTQCHTTPASGNREPGAGNLKTPGPQNPKPSFNGPGLRAHTFHAPDSAGSRCISCHMSDVNWRLLIRRRDHTFQPPVPENTAQFGIPNACTTCHDNRSPEWAAKQMNEWWGDGDRRAKAASLADTMYRAGSGDTATLPALASLAVDRSEGFLVRASAAEYIGRLVAEGRSGHQAVSASMQSQTSFAGSVAASTSQAAAERAAASPAQVTPAIINALIGAASDPEAAVRVSAVASLGSIGDRNRSLVPIVARLRDQARVVRAKAAEVLVSFGIFELPGPAGEALRRAQDEYIVSLDAFPDTASNHAAKGWLEAERGNVEVARDALNKASAVEPSYAFPWVVKGVLLAREGKFAEAVEMWKKARSIEPSYPNIEQLIAEAEKRK
ncbi:MAG TPA: cytochrome c3 family protein [Vicinamibacterales bacterium]|nr:cytochrome c3 family protein [Vicinamibacterales bacterium]